jgi:antitoxin HicB
MKYNFKIFKESKGYYAECIELEGCRTQGDTMEELKYNMAEALNLYLEEDDDSTVIFKYPKKINRKNVIAVEVDPTVALAMTLRQTRLKKGMTQTEMMKFLDIKNLSNYQRLENPKKSNPEFKTLITLVQKIPSLDIGKIINSYRYKAG